MRIITVKKSENYRGALVYRQEDGYAMVTMTVSVASDEHSQVTSHACNLPIPEDAEHLEGVDLYHFAVTDGTKIQLTITSPIGVAEAWYTIKRHTVLAVVSFLHMSIVRASESIPFVPASHSSK
jgi:hypothetical protein